jgi:hypothetical protein
MHAIRPKATTLHKRTMSQRQLLPQKNQNAKANCRTMQAIRPKATTAVKQLKSKANCWPMQATRPDQRQILITGKQHFNGSCCRSRTIIQTKLLTHACHKTKSNYTSQANNVPTATTSAEQPQSKANCWPMQSIRPKATTLHNRTMSYRHLLP